MSKQVFLGVEIILGLMYLIQLGQRKCSDSEYSIKWQPENDIKNNVNLFKRIPIKHNCFLTTVPIVRLSDEMSFFFLRGQGILS